MGNYRPFYKWFPKDFASDSNVIAMTNMQELIFRRLLDRSWEIGSLPGSAHDLAKLARVPRRTLEKAWVFPLTDCWAPDGEGRLINQRLEDEREDVMLKSTKARSSSLARWEKRSNRLKQKNRVDAIALRTQYALDAQPILPKPELDAEPKPDSNRDPEPSLPSEEVSRGGGQSSSAPGKAQGRKAKHALKWELAGGKGYFIGDREELRVKLESLYLDELGSDWMSRTWQSCLDWCRGEGERKMAVKKDCWRFVLAWFRRDAKDERERLDASKLEKNDGLVHTDESRAGSAAEIAACGVDHETDFINGGSGDRRIRYCPERCGWVEREDKR